MKKHNIINFITKIAIFSAIASVLYMIPFSLPFFPSFLKVQFSSLPAIIGGFIFGPLGGIVIIIIKTLVNLPWSKTGGAGELADFIFGIACVLSSSLIYRKIRTKKGAVISLIVGSVCWILSAMICNYTFLIDIYSRIYADYGGLDMIIKTCQKVLPNINHDNFMRVYIFGAVLPFNLMVSTVVSLVTFFVYKRLSVVFKKDFFEKR